MNRLSSVVGIACYSILLSLFLKTCICLSLLLSPVLLAQVQSKDRAAQLLEELSNASMWAAKMMRGVSDEPCSTPITEPNPSVETSRPAARSSRATISRTGPSNPEGPGEEVAAVRGNAETER